MITVKAIIGVALVTLLVEAIGEGIFYMKLELERKRYIKEMEEERKKILERPDGEKQKPNIF